MNLYEVIIIILLYLDKIIINISKQIIIIIIIIELFCEQSMWETFVGAFLLVSLCDGFGYTKIKVLIFSK